MRSVTRLEDERKLVNAFTQSTAGPMSAMYRALVDRQDDPRMQRLLQEGIERRRALDQGKQLRPLPVGDPRAATNWSSGYG